MTATQFTQEEARQVAQQFLKQKGDKVSTKQTIGTVAQNASSNTYELHFEIWKNDRYVNPNEWLARK